MRNLTTPNIGRPLGRSLAKAWLAATFLASAIMVSTTTTARAQGPLCAPRDAVLAHFEARFDEHPVSIGVTATGSLLEVLASQGGSWTIVITQPGGLTCVVLSGEGWRGTHPQEVEEPAV